MKFLTDSTVFFHYHKPSGHTYYRLHNSQTTTNHERTDIREGTRVLEAILVGIHTLYRYIHTII